MSKTSPHLKSKHPAGRQAAQPEIAALLLCMLVMGGCGGADGPKRVTVGGYVSFDGAPLKSGSIRFIPTEGTTGPAAVAMIDDGFYELPRESGPVLGKHHIEIEATNHLGFELDNEQDFARKIQSGEPIPKNPVPEAFNRLSQLVVELPEEGKLDLDFRLTSAGVLADLR